jgi:hypothetical protein
MSSPETVSLKDVATLLLAAHAQIFSDESLLRITKQCDIAFANESDHSRAMWEWFYFGLYAIVSGVQSNFAKKPDVGKAIVREVFSTLHFHFSKAGFTEPELKNKLDRIRERFGQFDTVSMNGEYERLGLATATLVLGIAAPLGKVPPTQEAFMFSLAANKSYAGALTATNELFEGLRNHL